MSDSPSQAIARRLRGHIAGELLFDDYSRGRYATDASMYQMLPLGVVVPRSIDDVRAALETARAEGAAVLARGGGTSQCGQTVNTALVIDNSKYLDRIVELDVENRRCVVEPGITLDELNRALKPHGLWFPVDVSTASRATIGGMAGNNSGGSRSLRYGIMRDNVLSIDAILADGCEANFGVVPDDAATSNDPAPMARLQRDLLNLGRREADEIARRFPRLMRRVGGYNIDALVPGGPNNLAHLLIGSEGSLAYSSRIELRLAPLPRDKVLGVCHFPTFRAAMEAARHLVQLDPTAVELIDNTMIALARDIAMYRPTIEQFVRGDPEALLLVEFAEDEPAENLRRLQRLHECMADIGYTWSGHGNAWGGVLDAVDPTLQSAIFEVRKAGLNIMMSMKQAGKPISFVEDCAVELEHLADYTEALTAIFTRHGTRGTWYAHASVGCLHVRPVLNLKLDEDVRKMRSIAEEAFELVRKYKGSHSGEHGDGIVRSEFHEPMFGARMVSAFEDVKACFDPAGMLNPGKIVAPPKMDDRSLLRYPPDYRVEDFAAVMDWSDYPGAGGGFQGAVEMCNNNGACRKLSGGVMCPSFRVTRNERDLTRGRANTLRLALSGQLGPQALTSEAMAESLKLCVSCKACKRECPTGVDMARMKIEVAAARVAAKGIGLRERLIAYLPRYAPWAAKLPWLMNLRDRLPGAAHLSERLAGFTAQRRLPRWRSDADRAPLRSGDPKGREVILFGDTFNTYFEPENLAAARAVLGAAGYQVLAPRAPLGDRPVCCGRTFLTMGLVEQARAEARRLIDAYWPYAERGVPIVGLEPSCLFALRDELTGLFADERAAAIAAQAQSFEEFLATAQPDIAFKPLRKTALLHGHCHQKAFNAMSAVEATLRRVPELHVETVESSCCGMAGAFGYAAETFAISLQMAELSLLPAVRQAGAETLLVADGTSCREQIAHGADRKAMHVARVLQQALA